VNNGATTAYYTYNGNGQRVKKSVSGSTTIFHYSLNGQIIAESDSAGTITAEYVYLNNQPLAKIEGANTYYYHNDHLGTPQKMTDSSGTVVWSADYKPFGEATITVSTITSNLRFPGQYYDAETGLHQNGFRTYNPPRGGYNEADPIGLTPRGAQGGLNPLFVYVYNNPNKYYDPTGLWPSGNLISRPTQTQDNRCTLDAFGPTVNNAANNNRCVKKCCQDHDNCYTSFNCNQTSWIVNATVGLLGPCNVCNANAVVCIAGAVIGGCPPPPCPK
jgi:RHS repeat-associated protein